MSTAPTAHRPSRDPGPVPGRAIRDRRRAWLSMLLYPVSFVAAFVVGEGLAGLMGYPAGGEGTAPWYVGVVAGVPAIVVFVLPGVLSTWFGRRAARGGDPSGMVPAFVALAIGLSFVAVNVLSFALILLR